MAPVRPPRPQLTPQGKPFFAEHWGIDKHQVQEYVEKCKARECWDDKDNVRAFVQKYIIPDTLGTGMGLSLLINKESPKRVNTMISHTWDENATMFFEDLRNHVKEGEVMFICCFAIYQSALAPGAQVEACMSGHDWQRAVIERLDFREGQLYFTVSRNDDSPDAVPKQELPCEQVRTRRKQDAWLVVSQTGMPNSFDKQFVPSMEEAEALASTFSFGWIILGPDGKEAKLCKGFLPFASIDKLRDAAGTEYEAFAGLEPTIAQQLGSSISDGPFKKVIECLSEQQGRMIVVTCAETVLYTRLWCVWEAYVAVANHIPLSFINRGKLFSATTRLPDAVCSSLMDTHLIQTAIASGVVPCYNERSRLRWLGAAGSVAAYAVLGPQAGLAVALVSASLTRDKRNCWERLEAVVKHAVVQGDHVSCRVDQAIVRTVKKAPGIEVYILRGYYSYRKDSDKLGDEIDVTEKANELIKHHGVDNVAGGQPLCEAFDLETCDESEHCMLIFRAGGHERSFDVNSPETVDLRPLLSQAWSEEPLCYEVVRATYRGSWDKEKKTDVTEEVNALLRENGVDNLTGNMELNTAFAVDPAKGQSKELEVAILGHRAATVRHRTLYGTLQRRVDLSQLFEKDPCFEDLFSSGRVELITRAIYRCSSDHTKFVNITAQLNQLCKVNPREDVTGGFDMDTAFGVDPAPGRAKELVVTVPCLRTTVFPELNTMGFALKEFSLKEFFQQTVLST